MKKNTHQITITFKTQKHLDKFKNTPTFSNFLHSNQLEKLVVGDNKITVNNYILNRLQNYSNIGLYNMKRSVLENQETPLVDKMKQAIEEGTPYCEFAEAVAQILRDDYGSHTYKPFVTCLVTSLR